MMATRTDPLLSSLLTRTTVAALALCSLACVSSTHSIEIQSQPSGALIRDIYQGELGSTPQAIEVEHGDQLDLVLTHPARLPITWRREYIVKDETVRLVFPEISGTMKVRTEPGGGTIRFWDARGRPMPLEGDPVLLARDGADPTNTTYRLPPRLFADSVGASGEPDRSKWTLTVEVTKPGYVSLRRDVSVEPHGEVHLTMLLERVTTELVVGTDPTGAEVFEKTLGYLGRTPLVRDLKWEDLERLTSRDPASVSEVYLHLELRKTGFTRHEFVSPLRVGATNIPIDVTMRREKRVRLRILTSPRGAEVYEKTLGYLGTSPLLKELDDAEIDRLGLSRDAAGAHFVNLSLTILKDEYRPLREGLSVHLDSGTTELDLVLDRIESEGGDR